MRRIAAILMVLVMAFALCGCASGDYKKAEALLQEKRYEEAGALFDTLGDYKDSADKAEECRYLQAAQLYEAGEYAEAAERFSALGEYKDSEWYTESCAARQDPVKWLEDLICERGEYVAPADGTPSYHYVISEPIWGSGIEESAFALRYFPSIHELRMELHKVESARTTNMTLLIQMDFSGEVFEMVFEGGAPSAWATVQIDPESYVVNGSFALKEYFDLNFRSAPNALFESCLNDAADSCLELFAGFLEEEGLGITLRDFGFLRFDISGGRTSPLLEGELTDPGIIG